MIRAKLRLIRFAVAILGIAICLFLIQASARIGFSRLLARYAVVANSIPAADEAVRLSPSDPELHRARATVFNRLQMPADAAKSLETAVSLRNRDDYLWLELGTTREEIGDTRGALDAFDQAVRWAPYYAHTHWHRGNLLLRMGRSDEAFAELRTAATANERYLPNLIDLSWSMSRGDVNTTVELIGISDEPERLALIKFLARHGKGNEAIEQTRLLTTPLSDRDRTELVRLLFSAKAYRAAFAVSDPAKIPSLLNGGFEEPFIFDDAVFGWTIPPGQNRNGFAIDVSEKFGGSKSLQINLDGEWIPGTPLLSQTVVLDPSRMYRLSFAVKTKDLVTGGPPIVTVSDATTDQLLAKSDVLPSATSPWVTVDFNFNTLATTEAVVVRLQRNSCESGPCPIFGVLWLDEFKIE